MSLADQERQADAVRGTFPEYLDSQRAAEAIGAGRSTPS